MGSPPPQVSGAWSARARTLPPWGTGAQRRTGAGAGAEPGGGRVRPEARASGEPSSSATIAGQWPLIRSQEIPILDENVTAPVDAPSHRSRRRLGAAANHWLPAPPHCHLLGAPRAMGSPSGPGGRADGSWAGPGRSGRVSEPRRKKSCDDRTLVARTLGSPHGLGRSPPPERAGVGTRVGSRGRRGTGGCWATRPDAVTAQHPRKKGNAHGPA